MIFVDNANYLDQGSIKTCYNLNDGRVVLVGDNFKSLRHEQRSLRALAELGFPTLPTKLVRVRGRHWDAGEVEWGLLAPFYDHHCYAAYESVREILECDTTADQIKKLKPGHIEVLRTIAKRCLEINIGIDDAQFLFRGDDDLVVCDAMDVEEDGVHTFRQIRRVIRAWRQLQRQQAKDEADMDGYAQHVLASEAA